MTGETEAETETETKTTIITKGKAPTAHPTEHPSQCPGQSKAPNTTLPRLQIIPTQTVAQTRVGSASVYAWAWGELCREAGGKRLPAGSFRILLLEPEADKRSRRQMRPQKHFKGDFLQEDASKLWNCEAGQA